MKVTVGIVGAGALGMTYAALLSEHADITLLTRTAEQAKIINEGGIKVISDESERVYTKIKATNQISDLKQADAIIIAVKTYAIARIAKDLSGLDLKQTEILTFQNGLTGHDNFRKNYRYPEKVYAGVSRIGARRLEPNVIRLSKNLTTKVDASAKKLGSVLNESDFNTTMSEDINGELWNKMSLAVAQNVLSAISGMTFGEMAKSKECLEIAKKILEEFEQVANCVGIQFNENLAEKLKTNWTTNISTHRASMWQDLQAGRKTEIDAINGAIIELGKKYQIKTPVNETVTKIIKILETRNSSQA